MFKINVQLYDKKEVPPADSRTVYSVPSDLLYQQMLQPSDNFVAEQLLLVCSSAMDGTMDTQKAIKHSKEHFLKDAPSKLEWVDASGLSRYNLFTPNTLVYLLEKIYHKIPFSRIQKLFPAGGESGTIRNWYANEQPFIYAKTGTLRHRHALSGYLLTKKNKVLVFSFMHNNYTSSSKIIKEEMDKVLRFVREEN